MTYSFTREEVGAYNKDGKSTKLNMIDWILEYRSKNNAIEVEVSEVKTEREEVMEALDSIGVDYKKNVSTVKLKDLLMENS